MGPCVTSDSVVDDTKTNEAQTAGGDCRNGGCLLPSVIKEGSLEERHLIQGLED